MSEEIEKLAIKIAYEDYYGKFIDEYTMPYLKQDIMNAIQTQVEAERERIAVYLEGTETWEGREFAKAIRNKPEKE